MTGDDIRPPGLSSGRVTTLTGRVGRGDPALPGLSRRAGRPGCRVTSVVAELVTLMTPRRIASHGRPGRGASRTEEAGGCGGLATRGAARRGGVPEKRVDREIGREQRGVR